MKKEILIAALYVTAAIALPTITAGAEEPSPISDVHIHYSHDAWDMLPPVEAIKVLKSAGLKKAFVSSSSDDGTQMLYKQAPELIVPVLRPYRRRGETSTWFRDETVIEMIKDRLSKNRYAGIGEFHVFGSDADLPVVREVVKLAAKYKIFLHAHSDPDAVDRIFQQNPDARVLWAHSGFESPEDVAKMLRKHENLTTDLAFRSEHASGGKVDPQWRKVFLEFPNRFLLGTDTYTPERWFYVVENANASRQWLKDLPSDVATKIAYRNAETLARWAMSK
jgi:predicted TIM-barrel fold metal-dependent hydrolase